MVFVGILRHHATQLLNSVPKQKIKAIREQSALMRSRMLRTDGALELPQHGFQSRKAFLCSAFEKNQYVKNPEAIGQQPNPLSDPSAMENMMDGMKKNMAMIVPQTVIMSWITFFFSGFILTADGMRDMQQMQMNPAMGAGGPPDSSALFKSEKEFLELANHEFRLADQKRLDAEIGRLRDSVREKSAEIARRERVMRQRALEDMKGTGSGDGAEVEFMARLIQGEDEKLDMRGFQLKPLSRQELNNVLSKS
ncbi:ER membrane complex subunit 3 [Cladochytrium tenue]|nr:ER membrane complex subunit 3 [Cladochytrium tenue]